MALGTPSRLSAREALLQAAALLLQIARESEPGGAAVPPEPLPPGPVPHPWAAADKSRPEPLPPGPVPHPWAAADKSRGGAGATRLTARQREVARLAAGGCTARQIAEALAIGRRTVETHLGNAYARLGVTSKLELVRRASELDL